MKNRTIKNSIFSIIKTICTMIFPVITFSYASRIFLADGIGRISFANSFISIFSMISMLGIRYYGIRECAKKRDDRQSLSEIYSELIVINTVSTLVAYAILFINILFSQKVSGYKIEIELYSITLILSVMGVEWLYTALEDYKYLAIRSIIIQVFSLFAVVLLIHKKEDLFLYIIIQVVATSGVNIIGLFHAKKYVSFSMPARKSLTRHLRPIINLFLVTVFIQIFTDMDTVMLGFLSTNMEVGLYSAAYKISMALCSVITAATTVMIPQMAYVFEKGDEKKANELLRNSAQFILMIGIPLSIGSCIFSRNLIGILNGKSFTDAAASSMILSLRTLLSPINGMFLLHYIIPQDKEKDAIAITAASAVLNILLNVLFIPSLGSAGASIATVCSEMIELLLIFICIRSRLSFKSTFLNCYQYCIAAIPVLMIAMITNYLIDDNVLSVLAGVLISAPVYFVILYFLKNEYFYMGISLVKSIRKSLDN